MARIKKSDFLYASTKSRTKMRSLLDKQQIENLISARLEGEFHHALLDMFLGRFITDEEDINKAIERCIFEAKKELIAMTPQKEVLDILWVRYDFLNLKSILKGKRLNFSHDTILSECSLLGMWDPSLLLKAREGSHGLVPYFFEEVIQKTKNFDTVYEIDFLITEAYFAVIKEQSEKLRIPFITAFVKLLIDLYNLQAALRAHSLKHIKLPFSPIFGGSLPHSSFLSKKSILEGYAILGGKRFWKEAIDEYETTGNFTVLETKANRFLVKFIKEKDFSIFSPAGMYEYFLALRNDLQVIRAIYVSRRSGIPTEEIRYMLRR